VPRLRLLRREPLPSVGFLASYHVRGVVFSSSWRRASSYVWAGYRRGFRFGVFDSQSQDTKLVFAWPWRSVCATAWHFVVCVVQGATDVCEIPRLIVSPGESPLAAPTPPGLRVRVRRFRAVLADSAALPLCPTPGPLTKVHTRPERWRPRRLKSPAPRLRCVRFRRSHVLSRRGRQRSATLSLALATGRRGRHSVCNSARTAR